MSEEQVSTMARLYAERLMRGDTISEAEMRVIMAGLMLSVDKLANAFNDMHGSLWSEEKMREMIADEVTKHCAAHQADCGSSGSWAASIGRFVRTVLGK